MPINPKTITVFLDPSPAGKRRAARAAEMARTWDAHLVGVYVVFNGVSQHPSMAYARSEKAIAGVVAHERRVETACQGATADLGGCFEALCAELGVRGEFRPIQREKTTETAIINSLHSDLLACGVPLLIVPNEWEGDTIGDKILIGWNASPEARRAVSDAMCLLVGASSVTALVVDPAGCKWLGQQAGRDLSDHLGRHGARVSVEEVASHGRPIAKVILNHAKQSGSDLIVVGARNPVHLREILFGNATRTLLTQMPVPVLVSR
jgi:nucleotide-binding universal stress UspA family protein